MRQYAISVALMLIVGCQGSTPNINPLGPYGPTQIPPPPTGTAGRADPYYRRSANDAAAGRLSQVPAQPMTTTFTSNDQRTEANVADRRAGLQDGASVGSPSGTTPTDALDWRSPVTNAPSYPASTAAPSTAAVPRPRFPQTSVVPAGGYPAPSAPPSFDAQLAQSAVPIPAPQRRARPWPQQTVTIPPTTMQPAYPANSAAGPSFPSAPSSGWTSTSAVGSGVGNPPAGYNAWNGQ